MRDDAMIGARRVLGDTNSARRHRVRALATIALAAVSALFTIACEAGSARGDNSPESPPRDEAAISIEGNDGSDPGDHLVVGQRSRLDARAYRPGRNGDLAKDIDGVTLDWRSSDERIIAVDSAGSVVARAPGRAFAIATVRALRPEAHFAAGVVDSMPFTILPDTGGLAARRFHSVSIRDEVTCVVTDAGRVECLRNMPSGTYESSDGKPQFAPVAPFGNAPVVQLAAGSVFACALLQDASAWCWGDNSDGQLGDGTGRSGPEPRPVAGALRFRRIDASMNHACGVTTDSALYCWGMMLNGGMGARAADRCSIMLERTPHKPEPHPVACARRPVRLLDDVTVRDVAVGADHTCAIADDQGRPTLFCWGSIYNIDLQARQPTRFSMPPDPLVSLVSGAEHLCGLTAQGEAWCWGRDWYGQLGAPTPEQRGGSRVPVRVEAPVRFTALSAGSEHTCGIASDAQAWCWGHNRRGEVGRGRTDFYDDAIEPTRVVGGLRFRSAGAGARHTCGVTLEGGLWCWGSGLGFRVQPGSLHEQPAPFPVAGWLPQR